MSIMKITKAGQPIDDLFFNIMANERGDYEAAQMGERRGQRKPPSPPREPLLPPSKTPYYVAALSFLCMAGMCLYLLGGEAARWSVFAKPEKTLAYLEVRVIGSDLGPVVGAQIFYKDKLLGKTNSFGEWKRQFRVRLGSTFVLRAEKTLADTQNVFVNRRLMVPMEPPKSGPLRLGAQMKLPASAPQALPAKPQETPLPVQAIAIQQPVLTPMTQETPKPSLWAVLDNPHATSEVDIRKQTQLRERVLPLLKQALGSPLTVQLQHLPFLRVEDGVGVIEVSVHKPGEAPTSFIKPYTGNLETTLHGLSEGITSPHAGWASRSLKIQGLPRVVGSKMYVFGYEAQEDGTNGISFWQKPKTNSAYVTIVKDHRIIFRRLVSLEGMP